MDHLRLADRPEPEAGPGQVVLKMKAASLNYRDLLVPKRGYGALTGTLPLIPVSDRVGEMVAVGDGVMRVHVGDRVCPIFIRVGSRARQLRIGCAGRWEARLTAS